MRQIPNDRLEIEMRMLPLQTNCVSGHGECAEKISPDLYQSKKEWTKIPSINLIQ